jgi:peptide/nickel transport system substrate-binding protein/oligopeptide transport system substrate-binding protein
MRRLASGLFVLCCVLALATAASAQRAGGTLRAVFVSDPPTLDPAQATDTTSSTVVRQLFDALLELDEKLNIVPSLAERYTISSDQRQHLFTLRRGVRFHNGREMTAHDVKYSFERAARGKRPWVFEKILGARQFITRNATSIAGIRVLDDQTVEITLERPFAPFLYLMAYDAASIVPKEEAERRGAGFPNHPVGTGPFRFVSWRRDDQVVIERFKDHWRGAPFLDRVVFRIIPNELTRYLDYKRGNLDLTDLPTGHCRIAQQDPVLAKEVSVWPILGTHAVRFNVEKPPFNSKKLRQAIGYAIDSHAIVRNILEECVTAARGILPPTMPGFNNSVTGYSPNREKARKLLAEAGYPEGKGLPPIQFHFNKNDLNQRIAEVIQHSLREIGITVELRSLDWAVHLKLVDDGGAGFFRAGWIADYPDPENFLAVLFHSRNVGAAGNTSRYRNPSLDRLFGEADAMPQGPERFKKYQEAEQIILNDAPWISLYHYSSRLLLKPYVKGLERSPLSSAPELLAPLRKVWLER